MLKRLVWQGYYQLVQVPFLLWGKYHLQHHHIGVSWSHGSAVDGLLNGPARQSHGSLSIWQTNTIQYLFVCLFVLPNITTSDERIEINQDNSTALLHENITCISGFLWWFPLIFIVYTTVCCSILYYVCAEECQCGSAFAGSFGLVSDSLCIVRTKYWSTGAVFEQSGTWE